MTPKFKTGQEVWTQLSTKDHRYGNMINVIDKAEIRLTVQDASTKEFYYYLYAEFCCEKISQEKYLFKTQEEAKKFFDNLINIDRIR